VNRQIAISELDATEISKDVWITAQQHILLYQLSVEGLTVEKAARASKYANRETAQQFLRSPKGQQALLWSVRTYLPQAGIVGMHTMLELARHAKSETVRQLAAADLMNRAGLVAPSQPDARASVSEGLHISINLSNVSGLEPERGLTIEGQAVTQPDA